MFPGLARAASAALLLLLLIPSAASAHAELESADPAPDASVEGPVATVEATFTEPLDPARSRLLVLDEAGQTIAEGGVDPADTARLTMVAEVDPLAAGAYEVRWTTVTPDDAGVERGRYRFEVTEPPPTSVPTTSPTAGPTAHSPSPSVTPSATSAPAAATSTPEPSASPSSLAPADARSSDASVVLPLAALALVTGLAAVLLLRRRVR